LTPQWKSTLRRLFWGGFDGARLATRACFVLGILLLTAVWRIDAAVKTAYSTGWTEAGIRLPGSAWVTTYIIVSLAAFVALLVAVLIWQARDDVGPDDAGGQQLLKWLSWGVAGVAAIAAVVGAFFRHHAATGGVAHDLTFALICDAVALGSLGVAVVFVLVDRPGGASFRVQRMLQRHRINLIAVAGLALVLTVVPQTSGQAIDSIRTWLTFTGHGMDRASFGLATAVLLALVVYESSARLTRIAVSPATVGFVRPTRWFVAAAVLVALWMIATRFHLVGPALLISAGILAIVGLLELIGPKPQADAAPDPQAPPAQTAVAAPALPDEPMPEYLGIVPLLAISAITIASAIDAALSDQGHVRLSSIGVLVPGLILALVAVLMTRKGNLLALDPHPSWKLVVIAFAAVLGLAAHLILGYKMLPATQSQWLAAGVGFLALLSGVLYAWALFHADPSEDLEHGLLAIPVALAAGVAVFFGLHYDAHAVGNVLGVFGVVNLSLAFILAEFNYVVSWSLRRRAPRLLHALGMQQLPIVALIFIAWALIGLIKWPAEIHDARVIDPRVAAPGTEYQPRPSLAGAFARWVAAQPELAGPGTDPLPLVVVATHGGGIRAAYWTALALDCIVGVSTEGTTLKPEDPATCDAKRRSAAEQRRAARRIFLASGVSGGALGLYAYAEKLLRNDGSLGPERKWVSNNLGGDFAADTMGWALFHDVPNHFFAVRSRRGGICRVHLHLGGRQCLTQDRGAVIEEAFDRHNAPGTTNGLRYVWDLRASPDRADRRRGESVPLLIMNSTVTGGKTRATNSAANLSDWPGPERSQLGPGNLVDTRPVAGTPDVSDALCRGKDMRLSTAAMLAARFPFVSPSGRIAGACLLDKEDARQSRAACARTSPSCEMRLVDGGYAENSGLLTVELLLPSLRALVIRHNADRSQRPIAIVLVELDNHYRATINGATAAKGATDQTFVPLETSFGAHGAAEMLARAAAYRVTRDGCTITISPGLHPGLLAPLGWELSADAQKDLKAGLVRARPTEADDPGRAVRRLRLLQQWLGDEPPLVMGRPLTDCIP
jgi:hypothetical protein